jgi:iron complex transport system ATP-binding protein
LAKKIAVLPQNIEIAFQLKVEEFILMGRTPHLGRLERIKKGDIRIAEEAMEKTQVLHLRSRWMDELSGGERQRVFLAQALTQQPELLLLDEPTAHLDIKHQVEILELVKKLNKEELTVIMILHDLNLASEYCERVILLDRGRIFKDDVPQNVFTSCIIEKVYKTRVLVGRNPISSKPHLFSWLK